MPHLIGGRGSSLSFIIAGGFNASITTSDLASNTRTSSKSALLSVTTWSQHRHVFPSKWMHSYPYQEYRRLEETSICNIETFSILPESDILTSDHLSLCMTYTVDCVLRPSSPFQRIIAWIQCSDTVL